MLKGRKTRLSCEIFLVMLAIAGIIFFSFSYVKLRQSSVEEPQSSVEEPQSSVKEPRGKSTFASIRYLEMVEGNDYIDLKAWDVTNNQSCNMSVNTSGTASVYRIKLPYTIANVTDPIEYEQAWDVWRYCDETDYQWYKDSEGLRRDSNGWIVSVWDFGSKQDFSNQEFVVDTSNANALSHRIYYSPDGIHTWHGNWYTQDNLTDMPDARWVKVHTTITTDEEVFIRNMEFKDIEKKPYEEKQIPKQIKPNDSILVMLVTDTHWGGEGEANGGEGNGAEDDIEDWIACAKSFNPDYIFHIGDITDRGRDIQFAYAEQSFADIINSTNVDRIWTTAGGAHDGLMDYYYKEQKWKLGFYRILNQTSQWYTLKIGNNVFVFCGNFAQPESWATPYNYGADNSTGKAKLMNQNKVDWLDRTLAKWQGTGNNIFILYHLPLYDTNVYSKTWVGKDPDRLVHEHTLIKNIIGKYTDVVAWFNGHVHIDPDEFADGLGSCVSGASRANLPDHVHFIYCGDIWWEHGPAAR